MVDSESMIRDLTLRRSSEFDDRQLPCLRPTSCRLELENPQTLRCAIVRPTTRIHPGACRARRGARSGFVSDRALLFTRGVERPIQGAASTTNGDPQGSMAMRAIFSSFSRTLSAGTRPLKNRHGSVAASRSQQSFESTQKMTLLSCGFFIRVNLRAR